MKKFTFSSSLKITFNPFEIAKIPFAAGQIRRMIEIESMLPVSFLNSSVKMLFASGAIGVGTTFVTMLNINSLLIGRNFTKFKSIEKKGTIDIIKKKADSAE